jgi:L-lactate dehydrogenase (cytochrome)
VVKVASIDDFREAARRRLPNFLFEYIDGGSYSQTTLVRNVEDLKAISLKQQILRDVSKIDLSTEVMGQNWSMPVALAPVGMAGMNARRGETQAARAAEAAGVPFCLSTVSACSIEEVRQAVQNPIWFQLYVLKDRGFMREMLARAREAGTETLVFTVDLPVPGTRYRDMRSGMADPAGLRSAVRQMMDAVTHPHWAWDVGLHGRPHTLGNVANYLGKQHMSVGNFMAWVGSNFDPSIRWEDLDFIRQEWTGKLVLKGVLEADDARQAARLGADGVVVSNHGGRQLDGALSTVRALPPIVDAVGDDLTVLVEGGVRSGLDVLRMLALGAKGVLIGRAWAYALSAQGEAGVARMLGLFKAEMRAAMALTGVTSISQVDRTLIARGWVD